MEIENTANVSPAALWTGRILSYLPILLLTVSAIMKFVQPAGFEEGLAHLGWSSEKMYLIAIVELLCCVVYLIPRTAILGAILIAAYLGGAVATHVRVGDLFIGPVAVGIAVWLGLYLRDPRLRSLVPFTKPIDK
ncbi:DoxX family protein [soil metagenome]